MTAHDDNNGAAGLVTFAVWLSGFATGAACFGIAYAMGWL